MEYETRNAQVPKQATTPRTLEERIMNVCIPKSEAEWWAAREIETLRNKLRWNDIETAPHQTPVLLYWRHPDGTDEHIDKGYFSLERGKWIWNIPWQPSNWMPLPAPPTTSEEEGGR